MIYDKICLMLPMSKYEQIWKISLRLCFCNKKKCRDLERNSRVIPWHRERLVLISHRTSSLMKLKKKVKLRKSTENESIFDDRRSSSQSRWWLENSSHSIPDDSSTFRRQLWLSFDYVLEMETKQNVDDDDLCFFELFDGSLMIPLVS